MGDGIDKRQLMKGNKFRILVLLIFATIISYIGGKLLAMLAISFSKYIEGKAWGGRLEITWGISNVFVMGIMVFGIACAVFLMLRELRTWRYALASWLMLIIPYMIGPIVTLASRYSNTQPLLLFLIFFTYFFPGIVGGVVAAWSDTTYKWFYGGIVGCTVYIWFLGVEHLVVKLYPFPKGEAFFFYLLFIVLPVSIGGILGGLFGMRITKKIAKCI
jgi:hypothetical protein